MACLVSAYHRSKPCREEGRVFRSGLWSLPSRGKAERPFSIPVCLRLGRHPTRPRLRNPLLLIETAAMQPLRSRSW